MRVMFKDRLLIVIPEDDADGQAIDDFARERRSHLLRLVRSGRGMQLRSVLADATLKPGDRVIVTGDPGRDDGQWRMRLRTIVRPRDGWRWSEGTGARAAIAGIPQPRRQP